ncbi:MAG: SpoIIE family protein phosphatase, partial [Spirochaetales bacterium]|nr:SpoIIE family protein phosphatase [Spirochaetales bacterium]
MTATRRAALILGALSLLVVLSTRATAAPPDFYWENPARLSRGVGAYPQALSTAGRVVVIWQENVQTGEGGTAWLSLASYGPDGANERRDHFAGPFPYSGDAPVLFSAAADGNGTMMVAVSSGERAISLYQSFNGGQSFSEPLVIETSEPGVAPRIFTKSGGGWYLFVTRSQEFTRPQPGTETAASYESLSIFFSRSENGVSWTSFSPLVGGEIGLDPNFLPSAASMNGTDAIIFQTLSGGDRPSYQLYTMTSQDGGASWSAPRRFTEFLDPVHRERQNPNDFDNQRPHLARIGNELWVAWERRLLSGPTQIYTARVDQEGKAVPGSVERATLGQGNCSEPRLFTLGTGTDAEPAVTWFDDRRGSSTVYAAFRSGNLWTERDLSTRLRGTSTFGRAVYTARGLYAFWQSGQGTAASVIGLIPDTSARAPGVTAVDFGPGEPVRRNRATVRWTVPEDSSGILGFSYLWSRDPAAEPPLTVGVLETQTRAAFDADEDGDWFFSIRAQDYAGNWSTVSRIRFVRDTTPPGLPVPQPPESGPDGFLASNSFSVSWLPPPEADVAGYTWALEYLGPLDRLPARKRAAAPIQSAADAAPAAYALEPSTDYERDLWTARQAAALSPVIRTASTRAAFTNIDDGYWALSVAAIDGVGNVGEAARVILRADKFIPYTTVTDVAASRDDFGAISLSIVGRGFMDDGAVTLLAVDSDGREPYDRLYPLADGGFSIVSDRLVRVAEVMDLAAGDYRVGMYHPVRGWYFTGPRLSVDYSGTVKFGTMGAPWRPTWFFEASRSPLVSITTLFLLAALAIPALGVVLSLRQVVVIAGELKAVRLEALAILEGTPMPDTERQRAAKRAIRQGAGLTVKFTMTISLLVIFIVLLVSVPLGVQMLQTQSETLARGLEQRARVLLESAAQGGKSYLPARNVLELSLLPNQASAIAEAQYLTITGFGSSATTNPDVVWASNDPAIADKIDDPSLVPGSSVITDTLSPRIATIADEINAKAQAEVGAIADALQQLQDEGRDLAARLDEASQARLAQIAGSARDLEKTLSERLAGIADASVASEPAFDPTTIARESREYVFYKPILFRQGRESVYYRGLVRLSVSTATIVEQISAARLALFRSVAIVAVIALAAGVLGAFGLSRIIIGPLMKVVKGVETIRDEPDKKKLADFTIDIKTHDELSILAGTINDMTSGLVKAAKEAEFLTVGKGVQKMFIPLITNDLGEKLTTGYDDQPTHTFYGYYEGAKGVSGDYFDYQKLDNRFWSFIKCDVSGKGVPAALIMVGVATIFSTGFHGWEYKRDGIKLDELTARINDYLYTRGFKGLFAAFVMGVFDSQTGSVHLCHAGDKFVRVYKPATQSVVVHELASAPAAGAIDPELVSMSAAYKQVTITMDHGDSLLLYTDGFEESSRARRGLDFKQLFEIKKLKDREGNESDH